MSNIYDTNIRLFTARTFTGTEQLYKGLRGVLYTDGVQWLANHLNCYWMITDIAIHIESLRKKEPFMCVKFITGKSKLLKEGNGGRLIITNGNDLILKQVKYGFCDLTVESPEEYPLKFFLAYDGYHKRHILMLPSEY